MWRRLHVQQGLIVYRLHIWWSHQFYFRKYLQFNLHGPQSKIEFTQSAIEGIINFWFYYILYVGRILTVKELLYKSGYSRKKRWILFFVNIGNSCILTFMCLISIKTIKVLIFHAHCHFMWLLYLLTAAVTQYKTWRVKYKPLK